MLSRLSQLPKYSGPRFRKPCSGPATSGGFSVAGAGLPPPRFSTQTGAASSGSADPARCPPTLRSWPHPPTIRASSVLSRNDEYDRMIRGLSSNAASTARAVTHRSSPSNASVVTVERIPIPPNLHLDPRSSYASRVVRAAAAATKTAKEKTAAARAAVPTPSDEAHEQDDDDIHDDDLDDDQDTDDNMLSVLEREIAFVTPLPDRLRAIVQDVRDGSEVGSIWLNASVFGRDPIRIDLLKRAVDYHRAKKRGRRNAATKTIGEVSGSGRKRRQQKGTGRARVGHGRPPHFRGGAKAHGPKSATDYGRTKLNKKVRKQALCHALSQKLKENNVVLLNDLKVPSHKTRDLHRILQTWNVGGDAAGASSALILDHYFPDNESGSDATATTADPPSYRGVPANLHVASRNIPRIVVGNANQANVYELLRKEKLVLTLEALAVLEQRLKDY